MEEATAVLNETMTLGGGDENMKPLPSNNFLADIFDDQSINDLLNDWVTKWLIL